MPKVPQDLPMVEVSLDRSMNPVLAPGFSHVTGVDARERGSARKFPGFISTDIEGVNISTLDPQFFRDFVIQKGTANGVLRGFIIHNATLGRVTAYFYDTDASAWVTTTIASDASTTVADAAKTDATSAGTVVYVTYLDNASPGVQTQKTFFYDSTNSVYRSEVTGVGKAEGWTSIGTPAASAGGTLEAGTYIVAVRLKNTRRGVISGLSEVKPVAVSAGNKITSTASFSSLPTDWDTTSGASGETKVLFYRSLADLTTLFLETEQDFAGVGMALTWGVAADGGLEDEALARKGDEYNNKLDRTGSVPATARIGHHQGVTVMQLEGDDVDTGNTDIVFSPTHDHRPEDFPRLNIYRLGVDVGDIVQFLKAGDFLVAMAENAIIRFHKQGFAFAANTFELGIGPRSRYGSVAVGSSIFTVTESGLFLVEGGRGDAQPVVAVQRLITDEWVADIKADTPGTATPNIHTAYDEELGAVFIVNNAKQQAILIWVAAGRITLLDDFPWSLSASLPDPQNGGPRRALFYAPRDNSSTASQIDKFWTADVDRTGNFTMMGVGAANTLNGTITSAGTDTQLIDTGATWDRTVLGATVYVMTGSDETPSKAIVSGPTDTVLLSDNFDRANNNSLGSDWTETENAAADLRISGNECFLEDTAAHVGTDLYQTAEWSGSPATLGASDEPYRVRGLFTQIGTSNTNQPDAVVVYGRSEGVLDATTSIDCYIAILKYASGAINIAGITDFSVSAGTAELSLIQRIGTSGQVMKTVTIDPEPAFDAETILELEFNGDDIKVFLNGVEKLTFDEIVEQPPGNASPPPRTGTVGFGVLVDNATTGVRTSKLGRFEATTPAVFGTTLTLDQAITGKATSDRYTISPVTYEVRFPAFGGPSRLWNRHSIEQIGAYITNLTNPSATDNSRFRFLTFRAGSNTPETSAWVTLTENPDDLVGSLGSAHGFGIQGGLQNIEAGSSFELVATRVRGFAQEGNTRITAN